LGIITAKKKEKISNFINAIIGVELTAKTETGTQVEWTGLRLRTLLKNGTTTMLAF